MLHPHVGRFKCMILIDLSLLLSLHAYYPFHSPDDFWGKDSPDDIGGDSSSQHD